MRKPRHNPQLESHHTLVAQWETTGNDWIALYRYQLDRLGERLGPFTLYGYKQGKGTRCTGMGDAATALVDGRWVSPTDLTDETAIAAMERPWNGGGLPSAGAAFVLKCDHPSLQRVI